MNLIKKFLGIVSQKEKKPLLEIKNNYFYSQYGEDMILNYIFKNQKNGLYVDIGAYHPLLFSNTRKLHLRGWKGINIDANQDTIKLFNNERPNDINLHYAIADAEGKADYYKFLEIDEAGGGSGNSLSLDVKDHYKKEGIEATKIVVPMITLEKVLNKHLEGKAIDFMNIDVEGFDLKVLQSNNWSKFRPKILAVEIWLEDINHENLMANDTYKFLAQNGYKPFSNLVHTWFFMDKKNSLNIK